MCSTNSISRMRTLRLTEADFGFRPQRGAQRSRSQTAPGLASALRRWVCWEKPSLVLPVSRPPRWPPVLLRQAVSGHLRNAVPRCWGMRRMALAWWRLTVALTWKPHCSRSISRCCWTHICPGPNRCQHTEHRDWSSGLTLGRSFD